MLAAATIQMILTQEDIAVEQEQPVSAPEDMNHPHNIVPLPVVAVMGQMIAFLAGFF
jgi:hypothetical protein